MNNEPKNTKKPTNNPVIREGSPFTAYNPRSIVKHVRRLAWKRGKSGLATRTATICFCCTENAGVPGENIQRGSEKVTRQIVAITASNIDRFSKVFHWHIRQQICIKMVTKDPSRLKVVVAHTL